MANVVGQRVRRREDPRLTGAGRYVDDLNLEGALHASFVRLANLTALMSSGVYRIPEIEVDVTAVVTNTAPTGPVRGAAAAAR